MKLNADKCHLLVLGQRCHDPVTVSIGSADVVNSCEEKLLRVQTDSYWIAKIGSTVFEFYVQQNLLHKIHDPKDPKAILTKVWVRLAYI